MHTNAEHMGKENRLQRRETGNGYGYQQAITIHENVIDHQ